MKKQLESDIKSLLINYLIKESLLSPEDTLINELNLGDFSRRVDLAVLRQNRIYAYEIKSVGDSLVRLGAQVKKYLEYFDKVTVITAQKHTEKALQMTPSNVAIWELDDSGIKVVRRGKLSTKIDKLKLIEFMTVSDLIKLAKSENITITYTTRHFLEQNLIYTSSKKLRQSAINALKKKYKQNSQNFLEQIKHSSVATPNDLSHLKRRVKTQANEQPELDFNSLIAVLESFKNKKIHSD
ncbi:sce7726 family protein [Acinetobacter calcoaceticus]|uniref:sce7726 family protein n=1 Tax=Acinetobacter calcoaceticus TaxID=471 RepID=UPI003A843C01